MYAQVAIKLNTLLRNGAYGIVMRGVQKCTRGCSSLRDRKRLPLCCIKLDTATDPFLGSGSTLIAAEETGRICYGIELDEKFVDVIVWRYMEATGKDDVFVIRDGKKIPVSEIEESV